jgi:hypothetical protein
MFRVRKPCSKRFEHRPISQTITAADAAVFY